MINIVCYIVPPSEINYDTRARDVSTSPFPFSTFYGKSTISVQRSISSSEVHACISEAVNIAHHSAYCRTTLLDYSDIEPSDTTPSVRLSVCLSLSIRLSA